MTDEELKKAVEMLKDGKVPSRYLTELRDLGLVSVQYGKALMAFQSSF